MSRELNTYQLKPDARGEFSEHEALWFERAWQSDQRFVAAMRKAIDAGLEVVKEGIFIDYRPIPPTTKVFLSERVSFVGSSSAACAAGGEPEEIPSNYLPTVGGIRR